MWVNRNDKWLNIREWVCYLSLLCELLESECFINNSSTEFYSFVLVSFHFYLCMPPKCQSMLTFQLLRMVFDLKGVRKGLMCKQVFYIEYILHAYRTVSCPLMWLIYQALSQLVWIPLCMNAYL